MHVMASCSIECACVAAARRVFVPVSWLVLRIGGVPLNGSPCQRIDVGGVLSLACTSLLLDIFRILYIILYIIYMYRIFAAHRPHQSPHGLQPGGAWFFCT